VATYNRPGVFVNELPLAAAPINGVATATAAGALIAQFAQGPNTVTRVTSWYDFVQKYGGYNTLYPATFQVASFFLNGGTELYVRRVLTNKDTTKSSVTVSNNVQSGSVTLVTLEAKNLGLDGNNVRVKFASSTVVDGTSYYDLLVYVESTVNGTTVDTVVESFNGIIFNDASSGDFITNVLEYGSSYIRVKAGTTVLTTDTYGPVTTMLALTGATTPEKALVYQDYTGDSTGTNGNAPTSPSYTNAAIFKEFEVLDQPLVFFLPDVISKINTFDGTSTYTAGGWTLAAKVYNTLIAWAETTRNFVIVETAPDLAVSAATSAANDVSASTRAAVYYPHFFIKDPLGHSGTSIRKVAPSGAIAGLYMYTDRNVGPFKAPAGVNAKIQEALALEKAFTPAELDQLNAGMDANGSITGKNVVNAIRNLPGAGIVVMGARTLKQEGTANRYGNMRRSLLYIEKRLNDLATFAVFENNDSKLWARLITSLGSFLNDYRNQGGLRGTTVDDSFYIKCDDENNTLATIAAGEVHIEIGVALEYPAEFVTINLSQKTAQ
jgi:phage tail sheath protein FI